MPSSIRLHNSSYLWKPSNDKFMLENLLPISFFFLLPCLNFNCLLVYWNYPYWTYFLEFSSTFIWLQKIEVNSLKVITCSTFPNIFVTLFTCVFFYMLVFFDWQMRKDFINQEGLNNDTQKEGRGKKHQR